MKKIALLLVLALVFSCFSFACAGEETTVYESGDYKYILLEDGTAEITHYSGDAEILDIPAELDGYAVSSIGDEAFNRCNSLIEITIPDSVAYIGDGAFSNCGSLKEITIPDSVVSVGENPFRYCGRLIKIKVSPDNPTLATIDGVLFDKTEKKLVCFSRGFFAESYQIPQGITSIGNCSFYFCESLVEISIPDSVTSIGDGAFFSCYSLAGIAIPDGVTHIGENGFKGCKSLTSITIPDSVADIGYDAFSGCDSLTLTVGRDSYAAEYAKANDISYTYPDANDWLNS